MKNRQSIRKREQEKGFTLVEIAIVLVIIGLLLGGVLKGQEMMTNAKIKALTANFDGIAIAYYAYQDRTGRVPGDEDDDGLFDGKVTDKDTNGQLLFQDLREQGFINGAADDSTLPVHGFEGEFYAVYNTTINKNQICADNIPTTIAEGLDVKLDDGVADKGSILVTTVTEESVSTVCREL